MKILMQIRANAFTCSGGDTIQMQKTKDALEAMGYEVDLSLELRPDLSAYDVVHLFNITRVQETYIQIKNAVEQGKPVVLSTIYWPFHEFEKQANIGIRRFLGKVLSADRMASLKALAKFLLLGERDEGTRYLITHSYSKMQRYILENARVFLPNAYEEMNQIEKHLHFSAPKESVVVVPNAINVSAAKKALDAEGGYEEYKDWLICVGRIDTRKNQLRLLEAIEGSDYKLLLVGKCSPGQKKYFNAVMKKIENNPNVKYIEQIPNEELYQLYRACRVSVLPSWFETPGLVSLEAAAMGCNIVVTDKGTTKDYFGEYAFYCDVMDPKSIREQIDLAYNAPFQEAFREKIMKDYTWEQAAVATLEGYQKVLNEA
ncbi:MAG: glycosyltransferase family 4 protein [Ruminococcaceae bacterium]|nr:glycosyltransferase family 4 protein [Oscillospiraceae bacterium]